MAPVPEPSARGDRGAALGAGGEPAFGIIPVGEGEVEGEVAVAVISGVTAPTAY